MVSHSNWPSDFNELKKLEDILQCSICYEYIDTCMITSCSHNFCSLCIRKYLQFKTQCPTCFEETHGSELRKNRLVDEVIAIWVKLKDLLLFNVRLAMMTKSVKNESKLSNGIDSPQAKNEPENNRKDFITPKNEKNKKKVAQKLFSEKKVTSPEATESNQIVIDGVVIPSIFQPQKSPKKSTFKKTEDLSTCPVCNVDIPLRNVNMHLDSCLTASDPPVSRLKPKPEKREPIPKRVYALMKEKDLKKYLKDYGLSTNGDRKAMISRLTRYIVLYNAECDKEEPRPAPEILRQVEREEKDEKSTQSNPLFQTVRPPTLPPDKKKDPEAIEKANKEYLNLNRENFKKLIENMKARDGTNIKPLKPLNRIDSDDEDDAKPSTSGLEFPSTSRDGAELEHKSVFSQDTVIISGSENDVFKSPVKSDDREAGHINYKKTLVNNDDDDDDDCEILETKKEEESVMLVEDESDSYESVFDTSARSESSKTPKRKLTLSARKKLKSPATHTDSPSTSKIGEKFTEIFEDDSNDHPQEKVFNEQKLNAEVSDNSGEECTKVSDEEEDSIDEEETDGSEDDTTFTQSDLATPTKTTHDVSPEISPMKTRSTKKRKSQAQERTPTLEVRVTRSKRVKPSASPEY